MPILGLKTYRISPPHDPDAVFRLRTELAPSQILTARKQVGYEAMAHMAEAAGPGAVNEILEALSEGQSAEEIEARMDGPRRLGSGASEEEPGVEVGTGAPPDDPDQPQEQPREHYDLDWAAAQLIKSWSYRDSAGRKIPVKVKYIRRLDVLTRAWLHDLTWEAMQDGLGVTATEGNA